MDSIRNLLIELYGDREGIDAVGQLDRMLEKNLPLITQLSGEIDSDGLPLDSNDAFVITYGDQFQSKGKVPLESLAEFADEYLSDLVSGVHILPFFPYSSDDGFSIIDYRKVNEDLGTWSEVGAIGSKFRLMSDLVLNHCSAKSDWFKGFLAGDESYTDYFITADPDEDLSMIARPRSLPLLTEFETSRGPKHVWTTFSADQVDLNFGNPRVLLELLEVFLFHLSNGIQVIRLDAVAYVWKEIGHPSIHHPKTHLVVKLFRAICDKYFPWVIIITETNVPHSENISYFGDGDDEAHMIYQFSLPPLTLDAFMRGDSTYLSRWAKSIEGGTDPVTYFNFLASHDGVGVTPTHGILSDAELASLIDTVKTRGGLVSYKATAAGEIPYELNINYRDAVTDPSLSDTERAAQFVAAQAIMLTVIGVPGIYIHSILGSGNYREGVEKTGANRTINREKLDLEIVRSELRDPTSIRSLIYQGMSKLLKIRKQQKAFHPRAPQRVIDTNLAIFCVVRSALDESQTVIGLINLTGSPQEFALAAGDTGLMVGRDVDDLVGNASFSWDGTNLVGTITPWQVIWLTQ